MTSPSFSDSNLYLNSVKPVLRERCYACHGALKQEAGLRLDTVDLMRRGGDSGAIVQHGDPAESLLVQRISAEDESERMPPEGAPLSADQIASIRSWIAEGALAPEAEAPEAAPQEHWAFTQPVRPSLGGPQDEREIGVRNPIDDLIARSRAAKGLRPVGAVEPSLLLRRVYLDLIGLPPTPDELDEFGRDTRDDAYERVVDRLLDSPQYGERWGRHWMDVWRYSDWYGLGDQLRNSQKHLWHWRDWVVESLNEDKGYDRMILEMLAGDELAPTDPEVYRATGYLARSYYLFNRTTWLDETLEHMSKAFLGLTVNCTKCHDHKYDPISQQDYYALRAIFEPHQVRLDVVPGQTDLEIDGIPRAFDAHPDAVTYLHRRGDEKQPETDQPLKPNIPAFLASIPFRSHEVALPVAAYRPELQAFFWRDQLELAAQELQTALQEREVVGDEACVAVPPSVADRHAEDTAESAARRESAAAHLRAASLRVDLIAAMHAAELAKQRQDPQRDDVVREAASAARRYELAEARWKLAQAKLRAFDDEPPTDAAEKIKDAEQQVADRETALADPGTAYPLPRASIKALEGPAEDESSRFADYPSSSTGRRTALARWIVHPDNPLTARVAVNHIWLRHFGQPLVESVDDFGRRAAAPIQQPLLDWLACELVESGWQMKHIHRLIVTSQTYRLAADSAAADPELRRTDAENAYYWCRRPLRMQSEVVRDSLLHLADVLDETRGGPTVDPGREEPPYRRSLYFAHSRDDQHPLLAMFDAPDILQCYRRQESIVPQQALALANSRLSLQMAEKISQRIASADASAKGGDVSDSEFVRAAFTWLLCRPPTADELAVCQRALRQWRQLEDAAASSRARANLTHALLNHNDFISIR